MPQLNDLQTILLSTAAQRVPNSLYPLPDTLADAGARVVKALAALSRHNLIEERETSDPRTVHRSLDDVRYGLFVTPAGLAAIGVADGSDGEIAAPSEFADPEPPAPRITKSALVTDLLRREAGATLAELIAATGWLPHTTRAALTGLRKKRHVIERSKRGDDTCYRITNGA
jgi:hypothetical protein